MPIDPEIDPHVDVISPEWGASLGQSRLGLPDRVRMLVVDFLPYRAYVSIQQPGIPAYTVDAVRSTSNPGEWVADVRFLRSGAATLICAGVTRFHGTDIPTESDPVDVTVLPNTRQPIEVTVTPGTAAVPAANAIVPISVGGRSLPLTVTAHSPTQHIEVESGLPGNSNPIPLVGNAANVWTGSIGLRTEDAPRQSVLLVRDTDFFGAITETRFDYQTTDFTPPVITINTPLEDWVFVADALPYRVQVSGTVSDPQSGYQAGTLTYSFGGQSNVQVQVAANGSWSFQVSADVYGSYGLSMTARDNSPIPVDESGHGNKLEDPVIRQFVVASSYKPKSIDELLSPRSYLDALLKFIRSHIQDDAGTFIVPGVLQQKFFQEFGGLADPGSTRGEEYVNDLLIPVTILRQTNTPELAGLIGRWSFSETGGTQVGDSGRFGLSGQVHGATFGGSGTPLEGAAVFDGGGYVEVAHRPVMEVGRANADFSVSFWLYVRDRPQTSGPWRAILYKGHEPTWPGNVNRTFAMWLHPDSNKIHYRISTQSNINDGGNSAAEIEINRWTHVAYVKQGHSLRLYIGGTLDSEVTLGSTASGSSPGGGDPDAASLEIDPGSDPDSAKPEVDIAAVPSNDVVSNTDPLVIGKSPYNIGINGAIDEVRIYGFALDALSVQGLAIDRHASPLAEGPAYRYMHAAYEAVLVGLGTSFEELRPLAALTADQRRALARRLRLEIPGETADHLEELLPPSNDEALFEDWLLTMFGLPSTRSLAGQISGGASTVLQWQQLSLLRTWTEEDSAPARPYLDPDLVDREDLAPNHTQVRDLLRRREKALADQWAQIRAQTSFGGAASLVFTNHEITQLAVIEQRDQQGHPINDDLAQLMLTVVMFRRLMYYRGVVQFSHHEKDDLAHLLTQIWKIRSRYPIWHQEERALTGTIWPGLQGSGVWEIGHHKPEFYPWRGDARLRSELETHIATRLRDWETLRQLYKSALDEAQQVALPVLRDGLLGIGELATPETYLNKLFERLLVDTGSSGSTILSRADQAMLSLQTLISGIRGRRFETGHPSSAWKLRVQWDTEPKQDPQAESFDEEWRWMGSYGTWRAAMMAFLYPENALFPEMLLPASQEFIGFLAALRNALPLTLDKVATDLKSNIDALSGDEKEYFCPVAIALAFQRNGQYTLALDWYRKVFDPSRPSNARAQVSKLSQESNVAPVLVFDDRWTLSNLDPHANATFPGRWGNPYTRFTVIQIVQCVMALADIQFAAGTRDSREEALSLYLEAKDILALEELQYIEPQDPAQVYLPNPLIHSLRTQTDIALAKIRFGLSFNGTPMLPDPDRDPIFSKASSMVRPTPYHFKILIERTKQLAMQAQNLENLYLSAIEKTDAEDEKIRREAGGLQIADETVTLRALQEAESEDGVDLARKQRARSKIEYDHYERWMFAGPNANELAQLEALGRAADARNVLALLDASIGASQAAQSAMGSVPWTWIGAAATSNFIFGRAAAQVYLNEADTLFQLNGILASHNRRFEEWSLRAGLSLQDMMIGDQQIRLAEDRQAISTQERQIAEIQRDQARDMLTFLSNKFTNRQFYEWLQGVLGGIYSFFLRTATSTAQQAEAQLAFERQQKMQTIIKQDYWSASDQVTAATTASHDRRGITGSARLLQDIQALDQQAFDTEQRLLNLSQTFSLGQLFPIEFQEFRATGQLSFATTTAMFDEGFPGHYMRLIKKVHVSVIALIPPTRGIRATLSTSGLSRVVTADLTFPTTIIRQEPQSVSLTSPTNSTGVFDLDTQSELLYPFEGMGVDAAWLFELPPAANYLNFDTIFDVLITIDYTAMNSLMLRERVIRQMSPEFSFDRSWSVRRDLPDTWYDISNQVNGPLEIPLQMTDGDFPSFVSNPEITEIALVVKLKDDEIDNISVQPSRWNPQTGWISGPAAPMIHGVASSRQLGASGWRTALLNGSGHQQTTQGEWRFTFLDSADNALREAFVNDRVDDVLIVFSVSGTKPAWR